MVFATIAAVRLGLDDSLASLAAGTTRGTIGLDELGHGDPVDRNWLANLRADPHLTVHLKREAGVDLPATATVIDDEPTRRA